MTENEYQIIAESVLKPLSEEILHSENNSKFHLVEQRKKFDNRLLEKINDNISFLTKEIVFGDLLDRHKISACLLCALLEYSPFTVHKKGYNMEDLIYANELLGIYAAISLIEMYRTDGLKIVFPKTQYQSRYIDPYVTTLCIDLLEQKNNRKLKYSLLDYAQILYLLERYSIEKRGLF